MLRLRLIKDQVDAFCHFHFQVFGFQQFNAFHSSFIPVQFFSKLVSPPLQSKHDFDYRVKLTFIIIIIILNNNNNNEKNENENKKSWNWLQLWSQKMNLESQKLHKIVESKAGVWVKLLNWLRSQWSKSWSNIRPNFGIWLESESSFKLLTHNSTWW